MDFDLWRARFHEWLQTKYTSRDTISNHLSGVVPFFEFLRGLALASWTEANRDVLEEYRNVVFYMKNSRTGGALGVATQINRLISVKIFFKFLVRQGFLLGDPSHHLELPRCPKALPTVLTETEVLQLLAVPNVRSRAGIRDRTMLEMLYSTALRNGELCSLTLDQVDLGTHMVRLQKGKGDKGRVVPLGQEAQSWLSTYLEVVRPHWLRNPQLTAIFLDRWGHRGLSRNGLNQIVHRISLESGIGKTITPHTLRHSCATHMLKRGAGLRHLQQLLGHNHLSSTEHYTRLEVSDLRKVLSRCHPRERSKS